MKRFELSTFSLARRCSTTELSKIATSVDKESSLSKLENFCPNNLLAVIANSLNELTEKNVKNKLNKTNTLLLGTNFRKIDILLTFKKRNFTNQKIFR